MATDIAEDERFVEVDGHLIPFRELDVYKERRSVLEERLRRAMLTFATRVEKGGEGTRSGAFLVGILADGECHGFAHLDPDMVARSRHLTDGELVEMLDEGA